MADSILDLVVKLTLDDSSLDSGLKGASSRITGGMSKAANVAGAAVMGLGAIAVKTTADFDSSMSQVQATMLKTSEEMENDVGKVSTAYGDFEGNLRDFARFLGSKTAFSAKEAADALNYMALAGYNTQESMEMLPNVLSLAAAGGFDLARASDMVTDTQTAFGISAERTTQMVDEMAKAASTGNTSVEQLGDAFLVVGGLAQELNGGMVKLKDGTEAEVDGVQELEIALTAMANAGVKGSEAGTHMRNMLLKLSSPTDAGTIALEKMGVTVFDTEGKMRSLSDIFGDLSRELSKMSQEEKIQVISDLFNTRDMASAEALLNAVSGDWDKIGESILDAEGSAAKMAEIQLDNLSGQLTILKSGLQELAISFGTLLMPEIRKLTEWIQKMTDRLNSMDDSQKKAIINAGKFILVLAGVTKAVIGFGKLARAINDVSTLLSGLKGAAGGLNLAGNLSGMTSGLSGAVSAAGSFMTADIGATVAAGGAAAGATIGTAIAGGAIAAVGGAEVGKKIGAAIFPDDAELYESYSGIKGTFSMLGEFFVTLGERTAEHAQNAWNAIKEGVGNLVDAITNSEIFDNIKGKFVLMQSGITEIMLRLADNLKAAWQSIFDFFAPVVEAIKYTAGAAWDWIQWKISEKLNEIYTIFTVIWTAISEYFAPKLEEIKTKAEEIWNGIKETVSAVNEGIKSGVEQAYNFIEEHIFAKMFSIQEKIAETWETIKSNMAEKATAAVDKVKEVFEGLGQFFSGLIEKARTWGEHLMNNLAEGLRSGRDKVAEHIRGIGDKIRANIGHSHPTEGPLADDYKWMPDMIDLFVKGIESNEGKLQNAVQSAVNFDQPMLEYNGGYGIIGAEETSQSGSDGYDDVVTAITDALMNMQLIVNIGNRPIEAMITNAQRSTNYKSGGR